MDRMGCLIYDERSGRMDYALDYTSIMVVCTVERVWRLWLMANGFLQALKMIQYFYTM